MSRRLVVLATISAVLLPLAACAPMGPGTPTTTVPGDQWLGAGCLDGEGTDGATAPDLNFSGTPNVRGNAVLSATISGGGVQFSGNGTCSGQPVAATTIVRAPDQASAAAVCDSLAAGNGATSYTGSPWTVPSDAWACPETYLL
jgi:hypothetical protein